ncbi:hypothetical protein QYE76_022571 [Lolium multiflorum]|uniref:Uncharacterized protein n=1 Tax=Lolium multiflorum TaxID=4521 RepID=A0AAD8RCV3_LOLMU|nr:hypothetical protein QYE76_022571 [Lolium multiflorum]
MFFFVLCPYAPFLLHPIVAAPKHQNSQENSIEMVKKKGAATASAATSATGSKAVTDAPKRTAPGATTVATRDAPCDWTTSTMTKRDEKKMRSLGLISNNEGDIRLPDQYHDEPNVEDADNNLDDDEEVLLASVVRDPHLQDMLLEKTKRAKRKSKLEKLETDSNTPLYDSGRGLEESRLRVALDVLQMKAKHGWTDTSVDDILEYLKYLLPVGNTCPGSLAEAKRIRCPLDLPHEKYHACINDCIIYRKEHMDKTKCPLCDVERYKKGKNKAARKVVWYFPLAPGWFYADRKEAKLMRWHAERNEEVLTHPSDAS